MCKDCAGGTDADGKLTCDVVSYQTDGDVNEIVPPALEEGLVVGADDGDELVLEELVTVEEDVVREPGPRGREQPRAEVLEGKRQGLRVVAGDVGLGLLRRELLARVLHVEE